MPNLRLRRKSKLSPFRKIAIGTWRTTYDPAVYGTMTVRMENALEYMAAYRAATGKRLTVTHMMAKAVAAMFEHVPDANAILRFDELYVREDVAVFFQVLLEDPETGEIDLSGTRIENPGAKTLAQIIDEFEATVGDVRKGRGHVAKSRNIFRWLPNAVIHPTLRALSFLSYSLNLDLRWAGLPADPFGSIMITNIGSIGLEEAYAPLVPYSRCPLVVSLGQVTDEPVVDDGKIVPGKVMRICATFDHRVLDGAHAAAMVKTVRAFLESPYDSFGAIPASTSVGSPGLAS